MWVWRRTVIECLRHQWYVPRTVRIGYLINQYPKISHTFVRREISALEGLGMEVERFSVRPNPEALRDPADQAEAEKTTVILQETPTDFLTSGLQSLRAPGQLGEAMRLATQVASRADRKAVHAAYLGEALRLRDLCQERGVKHVHAHFGTNSATVAMLCQAAGGPSYSFTVHGPEEFDRPFELSLGLKVERSRFTCGISSFGRSQILRRIGYAHWDKVHVVRCGVDASFVQADSTHVPATNVLVCIGRLSEQKGQMILVEALGRTRHRDFEVRLIGDGELRAPLEQRVKELGLQRQVKFLGWASGEEVQQALRNARGMVLPSFAEGLPVVLMEAMAMARPVVTTYIAGIPELVKDKDNGWLVPAGDIDGLAEGIDQLLMSSTHALTEMGRRGRAAALQMHDVEKNAAELKRLFETA